MRHLINIQGEQNYFGKSFIECHLMNQNFKYDYFDFSEGCDCGSSGRTLHLESEGTRFEFLCEMGLPLFLSHTIL